MKFKTFGNTHTMTMLNYLLRRFALLVGVLAASHAWAQAVPSWNSIGPTGGSLIALIADPSAPTTALYVGTEMNGVFRSSDGGTTWSAANSGMAAGRHVYAMAALGNFVYAATDGGVYVAAAGTSLLWTLLPSPRAVSPAPACDITMLASAKSTLYLAAPCESNIYATTVVGNSPVWQTTSMPVDSSGIAQNVTALGLLDGNIALGSISAVYLLGADQKWINSEAGALDDAGLPRPSGLLGDHVAALVSSSSKWAFTCTTGGLVFQADLSIGVPLTWMPLSFATEAPTSCRGLAVARVNALPQSVLAMATDSGAFASTVFDDTSLMAPSLVPGPAFPMSSHLHAAWQLNPSSLSSLLWVTEFGLYASSMADLSSSTTLTTSVTTAFNGPIRLATPSQRLDNVSVRDVAVVGTSLYAIAESTSGSYLDVMASADGGASWTRTGLSTQAPLINIIRSLVADVGHSILYAGTDQGVYYLQGSNWLLLGNAYDVRAMAVGAQALYTGRNVDASPSGGLVIQSLVGGSSFTTIEIPPVANFSVRSLVVAGGSVYAAGGVKTDTVDGSVYNNAVYYATDFVPATPLVAPTWALFGSPPFPITNLILSHVAVGAGQVFAGGDGFLFQCQNKSGGWGVVAGLPTMSTGEPESVSALASDGTTLYVGTSAHGLLAMTLNVTTGLIAFSGTGTSALPSTTVNEFRIVGTNLYVATNAGVATATVAGAGTGAGTGAVGGGGGGGGGCSMAIAGESDPLLWLLVAIAALQIAIARRRRATLIATTVRVRRHKLEDRQ
jgi:hypothetical protein